MTNGKRLVVARVHIHGGVAVEARDAVQATLRPGEDLDLQVQYDIEEASEGRESYRIRIDSELGDQTAAPKEHAHRDVPNHQDSWIGLLDHRYRFDAGGTYEGRLRLTVEYGVCDWLPGRSRAVQRETVTVPLRIDVA